MKTETDVVVVGGGLAGLTAAAFLARAGRRVVVLERAGELGGRARTQERDGFHFNEGPHALYRGGPADRALRELGVKVRGAIPPAAGSLALRAGRLFQLPVGLRTLLTTRLFGFGAKRQVALLLARLPKLDPAPLARVSVADWLAETLPNAEARALAQSLVRVTTYAADDRLSAGAAVIQIQGAMKNGVLYLDGGWQTLVDALAATARTAGARLVTGATVASIESSAPMHSGAPMHS